MILFKRLRKWHILAILIFAVNLYSQENNCIEELKSIVKKNKNIPFGNEQVFYFDYSVKVKMRDKRYQVTDSDIKLVMNEKRAHIVSDMMKSYQNDSISFTILPIQKVIYISDSKVNKDPANRLDMLINLQSALLDQCSLISCEENVKEENNYYNKKIVLMINPKALYPLGSSKIEYYLKDGEFKRIIVSYPEKHEIERIECRINEVNYNYNAEVFKKPLSDMIYTSDGNLLPEYKEFIVKDTRIKK